LPLYPYRCIQCGHSFEKIQSFNDEPLTACPKCGGKLERPLTAPRLQFKGAGWYVNDYAAKSSGAPETAGTDSKPAAAESSAPTESKKTGSGETAASAPASTPPASTPSSSTPSTPSSSA